MNQQQVYDQMTQAVQALNAATQAIQQLASRAYLVPVPQPQPEQAPAQPNGNGTRQIVVAGENGNLPALIPFNALRTIEGLQAQIAAQTGLPEPLTPRELEVLQLLGQGLRNREIAKRLCISYHTAKTHVSNIYGKLEVTGRAEAVVKAQELGLLGPRQW